MEYVKPEVRVLASSIDAIQSSMTKGPYYPVETFGERLHATSSAYEADE
jgi:hypothetical protein